MAEGKILNSNQRKGLLKVLGECEYYLMVMINHEGEDKGKSRLEFESALSSFQRFYDTRKLLRNVQAMLKTLNAGDHE